MHRMTSTRHYIVYLTTGGLVPQGLGAQLPLKGGDSIQWFSALSTPALLVLPGCVVPQDGTLGIQPGEITDPYHVKEGTPKGQYKYGFSTSIVAEQSGTIDVS